MHSTVEEDSVTAPDLSAPRDGRLSGALRTLRKNALRFWKSSFGVSILGIGAWVVTKPLLISESLHAVVAGSATTLSAPIDGIFGSSSLAVGAVMPASASVGSVVNPWLDNSAVLDVETRLKSVEAELAAISPLLEEMDKAMASLTRGADVYQSQRLAQLRSVLAETEARIGAERARADEANARLTRVQTLTVEGVASSQALAEAQRDSTVAQLGVDVASRSRDGVRTQLEAARKGVIVDAQGMGSDRPYSRQRLDEVTLERARWKQAYDSRVKLREALQGQLARARAEQERLEKAALEAPRRSRIWQIFVASGAFVNRGKPLVSLVDCESKLVVASVSERVYERLTLGSKARFEARGLRETLRGQVAQMFGPESRLPDTLVAPGVLDSSEPGPARTFRVVLSFPDLAGANSDCAIGLQGTVTFE